MHLKPSNCVISTVLFREHVIQTVKFVYVYGSMHRWSILITVQRDATQNSLFIILQVHSTCFGCQQHPSSGVHKTVTTASRTGHIFCAASSIQSGQAWSCWREVAAQKIWPVPEAVVTVLCTPDDRCDWHSKHVEWTCRIINRLLCVASHCTVINTVKFLTCIRKVPLLSYYYPDLGFWMFCLISFR